MSEYVIQGGTLTAIADAIRAQLGTQQQYTPESMAAAIGSIQESGSTDADGIIDRSISGSYKNGTVLSVGDYAFYKCQGITSVYFAAASAVGQQGFYWCNKIHYAGFADLSNVGNAAFNLCSALTALVLLNDTVASLSNTNALASTPIASGTGFIYVPDDLVDQYKVATNWATYASQIKGLSEIPADVQQWLDQQGGASA